MKKNKIHSLLFLADLSTYFRLKSLLNCKYKQPNFKIKKTSYLTLRLISFQTCT